MWVLIGATSLYNGSFSTLFSLNGNKLSSNLSRIATVMWLFMALVITPLINTLKPSEAKKFQPFFLTLLWPKYFLQNTAKALP
ncbi:hypothetical protein ACFX11_031146 [Malus domestica]